MLIALITLIAYSSYLGPLIVGVNAVVVTVFYLSKIWQIAKLWKAKLGGREDVWMSGRPEGGSAGGRNGWREGREERWWAHKG